MTQKRNKVEAHLTKMLRKRFKLKLRGHEKIIQGKAKTRDCGQNRSGTERPIEE